MNKIISFCLWGANPKYTLGAVKNMELRPLIYPDFKCRFYIDETTVPMGIIDRLKADSEVVYMGPGNWTSMFWRFYAAGDADVMLSRDTDSRLSERERICVDEWLASDKDFHIIRDHPDHRVRILGGMWGARNGVLKNIKELCDAWKKENRWQTDQEFLAGVIYPIVKNFAFIHDTVNKYSHEIIHKINHNRINYEHVGSIFDENNNQKTFAK